MTKKLTPQEKQNRKPAIRACTFCHQKHLQCSNERPCKNCVKRNIASECHDIVRKRVKYLTGSSKSSIKKSRPSSEQSTQNSSFNASPVSMVDDSSKMEQVKSSSLVNEDQPTAIEPSTQSVQVKQESLNTPTQDPSVMQIKEILDAPTFDVQHNGSDFNNESIDLDRAGSFDTDPLFHTNTMLNTTTDVINKLLTDHYEIDSLSQPSMDPISQISDTPHSINLNHRNSQFSSNYLNEEYLMLGDILLNSKPASPSPSNTSASEYTNGPTPAFIQNIDFNNINESKKRVVQKLRDSRPFISLGYPTDSSMSLDNLNNMAHQTDNLLDNNVSSRGNTSKQTTNANSNPIVNFKTKHRSDYVSPLATHKIYKTVSDIYNKDVINFEYPNSYHALTNFLKTRFSGNGLDPEEKQRKRQNLLIILKLIASYRPTFISAHKSLLKPQDLLLLEMSFQRCLIDYEKLSQLNSSPTIIWRRTGEIVSITDDLLSLLGYKLSDILSKRTFIMEMMYDDESVVKYFQLFKSVAVGNLHSSISTKIKLTKKEPFVNSVASVDADTQMQNNVGTSNYIEFCSVWTVKRDLFDIPMLIIGQFLPILPAGDGVRMY
ncbi:Zcf23 protein [Candida orthopsilosis Co 90-125]|uniref:Glucose starvation modulator protein 1 n=1 Tax=Candida orthopsilosis (strain 90-125) TaxID=1136231 RepID=H8WWY1_CANO9|nr:Zcf23 protein [Candida orthopsilosis Co 90-125]CCG21121.1 Zcf23 protein [Candida orthopsilosis Co 90-125]